MGRIMLEGVIYSAVANGNWIDLGRMEYRRCWELQKRLWASRVAGEIADTILFVEHDAVITHGPGFDQTNLLLDEEGYRSRGIQLVATDRGGDVTYHGPEQLVIYPIFSLKSHGGDLHKWLRALEETIIVSLGEFGIEGYRFPPHTGVWTNNRKIAAIGIKVSRWVSLHGIALNCDNDLSPFNLIIPCGISNYGVTSLSRETGRTVGMAEAMPVVAASFSRVFNMRLTEKSPDEFGVGAKT
ncbi:MAG TPA: lipoyl(octanoyl) transferase LipB [Fimbriimonadales bacterium]|jgi:lipoyl(octanoyl) transferase|nr:lipoyl(octanoyl) transferase LipB [Fimbriimonadales bacterium]